MEDKEVSLTYHTVSKRYARDLYMPELQLLVDYGDQVNVRGRTTLEILNFVSEIREPWHHCILLPSRRWNPWLALSEFLWILAGRDDVAGIRPFNGRIRDFSDDGVHLYGAYGARISDQLDDVIQRLRKDPSDRRAVVSIWDKKDLMVESKDPPCNNMIYFKLRDQKLHMTVINRSNDIHWGLFAVNIPTFGLLQDYMAARLGVGIGTQTHFSNSLHVYTDQDEAVKITGRMLYDEPEDKPEYPRHSKAFNYEDMYVHDHRYWAAMASLCLDGETSGHWPEFFQFSNAFLTAYKEKELTPHLSHWHPWFADWILSGEVFAEKVWK